MIFYIEKGTTFKIYDIENRTSVIKSGKVSGDLKIKFSMGLEQFKIPLQNTVAAKSANNFGVYRVEFTNPKNRKIVFGRLFYWLF